MVTVDVERFEHGGDEVAQRVVIYMHRAGIGGHGSCRRRYLLGSDRGRPNRSRSSGPTGWSWNLHGDRATSTSTRRPPAATARAHPTAIGPVRAAAGRPIGRVALLAGAIGLAFLFDSSIFAAVIGLFVLVVPFEKLYPRHRGQRIRRPMVGTDISFALLGPLLNVAGITAIVVIGGLSLFWLPGLALRPLVNTIPAVALPVVGFVLFDFTAYWTHRFAHEVPFMWRFHAVHHSPEHMDWVSGFRVHPFDGVVIAPAFFFLLGAGFGAELAGVFAVFQIILGLFFHANVRVRWRSSTASPPTPSSTTGITRARPTRSATTTAPLSRGGTSCSAPSSCRSTAPVVARPATACPSRCPDHLVGQLMYPCRGFRGHLWLWRHPILS